jgi:hypothetical protein
MLKPGFRTHLSGLALALNFLVLALLGAGSAVAAAPLARFSAVAMDLVGGQAVPMQIVVNRWSTESERDKLMSAASTYRSGELLDTLQDLKPVGYIKIDQNLAWDVHFAQTTPGEDGAEHIVLITDRPTRPFEFFRYSRSLEYPFTVIELNVNAGKVEGSGTYASAAKITPFKKDNFVLAENYGLERVRLTQVKREAS